jgi:hypothetical protein
MSYIITSSSQDRYSSTKYGIEKSYSYENYLSNPLQIPPNSQVALESIKFVRLPVFTFLSDTENKLAYYWFGEDKTPTTGWTSIDDTKSAPASFTLPKGTYSTEQLAGAIQDAIRSVQYHTVDKPVIVTANYTTAGAFEGFTYNFEQKDDYTANYTPPTAYACVPLTGDQLGPGTGLLTYSVSGTTGTLTGWKSDAATAKPGSVIFPQHPISLTTGEIVYNISNTGEYHDATGKPKGGWITGLTRPQRASTSASKVGNDWVQLGDVSWVHPSYYDVSVPTANGGKSVDGWPGGGTAVHGYYDYAIGVCPVNGVPAKLEVVAIAKQDANTTRRKACPYYKSTDASNLFSALNDYYNMTDNATGGGFPDVGASGTPALKNIQKIRLQPKGEYINIDVYAGILDQSQLPAKVIYNNAWTPLVNHNASSIADGISLPPINMNKWALFPKVTMFAIDLADANKQSIDIESYIAATDLATSTTWYGKKCWWTKAHNDGIDAEKTIDLRVLNDYAKPAFGVTTYSGNKIIAEYNNQMVLQNSTDWDPGSYITPEPTLGPLLGWKTEDYLYKGMAGYSGSNDVNTYVSPDDEANIPNAEATHSLFVRCPTLTQQSSNFGKGSMSKIIYHCPMFSNTGKSSGSLFFQPAERVYIDLGNRETLHLNQISLEVVDKNEQLATDLTGSTTICLHIKQK